MAPEAVQPLRINKSPSKNTVGAMSRPLSEISPMGIRRNSPSFNQVTGKPSLVSHTDSSPFDASPENQSPRNFWKNKDTSSPARRDSENSPLRNSTSSSPVRRSSLEKLKSASRVTNSNMFAREHESDYDPASSPVVERPLVSGRPLSVQVQGNAWMGTGLDGIRAPNSSFRSGHKRSESNTEIPKLSPTTDLQSSPHSTHYFQSPQKSSLSSSTRFGSAVDLEDSLVQTNAETGSRSNTPRSLRQAKSVTFDNAPPQINEYEMITPDPSSIASGSREGSYDSDPFDIDEDLPDRPESPSEREDSFDESLEDTDKTPVVLPEDWRFMNPDAANTHLADTFDDPFANRPALSSPSSRYRPTPERDTAVARSSSSNSNGEHRPLPPLPPSGGGSAVRDSSPNATRSSPPRPASVTKAEILGMRSSPMPLDERLRLLSIENEKHNKQQQQQEPLKSEPTVEQGDDFQVSEPVSLEPVQAVEYKPPPRVSRESILRNLNTEKLKEFQFDESELDQGGSTKDEQIDYANLDPDEPIPSCEVDSGPEVDGVRSASLQEGSENGKIVDMYARSGDNHLSRSVSPSDEYAIDSSVIHYEIPESDISEVSENSIGVHDISSDNLSGLHHEDGDVETRERDAVTPVPGVKQSLETSRMSLPEFTSIFSKDDFDFGLESYLTPTSENTTKKTIDVQPRNDTAVTENITPSREIDTQTSAPSTSAISDLSPANPKDIAEGTKEITVPEATGSDDVPSSPASVIHHPLEDDSTTEPPSKSSEPVPEPIATIKAPGTKLKTRMSATPADLYMMSATRRQISGEQPPITNETEDKDISLAMDDESVTDAGEYFEGMSPSRRESLQMKLDVPLLSPKEPDLGIGEEFDRLLESKKKGYLMRQNTKVVVASHLNPSAEQEAGEASTKNDAEAPSGAAAQDAKAGDAEASAANARKTSSTWTTEPWNGRIRRHSTRRSNIVPDMRLARGPAPPLPGQESAVNEGLDSVTEDQFDEVDESGERGRLFVKVVGVKDLDLPLPKNETCYFQMTLDNGLHCVTTSWSELAKNSAIGQEFELVVFEDLEFQLTLQTKLERPRSAANSVWSNTPSVETKKPSALSRMFTSPKKRREREQKQREEEFQANKQREMEVEAQRASREPSAWDLQNELVGADGSFARAYVCLSNHEQQAFGRPFTVDIPCWNEWAAEDKSLASTRSKNGGVQRKPPYRIANMELQLLYIPRPKDIDEEEMPKSMASAMRQLKDAEATATRQFQGHLSQQGGDCPYWRRRFFKLHGSKLTAYHDFTRQPRATISLAKATKLIDDKSTLTKPDPGSPAKGKGRRKSAFAEEEEGYMFVEEGFRIRFQNGEVIDFYADNSEDKEKWMKVLSEAIGRENPQERKTWMSIVLAKERAAAVAATRSASKNSANGKARPSSREQVPKQDISKPPTASPQKVLTGTVPSKKPAFSTGAAPKENKPLASEQTAQTSTTSAAASKPSSPTKPSSSPSKQAQSASKLKTQSPVKEYQSPSKRNSGVAPSPSPRKSGKEITGKRQGFEA